MKVRYLGISDPLELLNGKVYDVVSVEGDWYRIVDETEEDYLYPPHCFEVVEPNDGSTPSLTYEECAARAKRERAKEEYRKPHEVLAHAGFGENLETPVGSVSVEKDDEHVEFEILRLFDRFSFAGCTTYFLGVATSYSKKPQRVVCRFAPTGHGSCFAESGERVESLGFDTEGYALYLSSSCNDPGDGYDLLDYSVEASGKGLVVTIPAKAPAQQLAFGVSWMKTSESDDGSAAWISSDPNFIGDIWLEATEEASKRCPNCGSLIAYRSRTDCLGYFCTKCDYSVVTQASYPMEDDLETYEVLLPAGAAADKSALSVVNKLLGCGYVKAKQAIEAGTVKLSEGDARETLRVIRILDEAGLAYEVRPPFPHHEITSDQGTSIWDDFEGGGTLGSEGSEGGRIVYDVEYIHGARVTIEETDPIPFSITCGIYGLFVHTAFAESIEEAKDKAAKIQSELADCINHPPADEAAWCDEFTAKW